MGEPLQTILLVIFLLALSFIALRLLATGIYIVTTFICTPMEEFLENRGLDIDLFVSIIPILLGSWLMHFTLYDVFFYDKSTLTLSNFFQWPITFFVGLGLFSFAVLRLIIKAKLWAPLAFIMQCVLFVLTILRNLAQAVRALTSGGGGGGDGSAIGGMQGFIYQDGWHLSLVEDHGDYGLYRNHDGRTCKVSKNGLTGEYDITDLG